MFGSTPFGGFGSSSAGGGLFGQSTAAQPQQQQASSLFGGGATPSFGGVAQQTPPAFGFGATAQAQSPSVFGQQPATGGLFGGTTSLFSAAAQPQQAGGTSTRFVAPTGQESVMKNGVTTTVSTRNQVITMMKEYEAKSFEELRLEDYQANRKGPQATTATTGLFGASTAVQPQTSLFGTNTATTGSSFGLFGQSTTTSTSTNLFGSQPKPIFGGGATTTPSFGATTTGFQFNQTSQAQPQSIFGATNAATTPAAPTAFSFTPQQPPTTTLWGQKPATQTGTTPAPAFGTGLFGTATTSTAAPSKPLFGSGSLFGTTSTATQPAFGTAATTPSIFSNSASAQQPAKPFGFSFPSAAPTTTTTQPLFGTNPSAAPATTNLFETPAATTPSAFAFGTAGQTATTPSFGFTTSGFGASNTSTPSLFTSSFQQQQPPQQQQQCFPSSQVQPYVPFATTPYKDNPIFYNLFSNRKLEEMTKPTSPLAMHEFMDSLRKKSSSPASLSWKKGHNWVPHPPRRSSSVSICKFEIWNGFDDDAGNGGSSGVNILVPKQNKEWKRLVLNSAPTTPLSCASCAKMTPPGKISPLSRSLNLSDSSPSRWLKSGGLVKQRTRLNLNALSSEFEFEENGNRDAENSSGFVNLSDSLSLVEGRRLSSTPRFRIAAILEEDEEIKRGAAEKEGGAGDFAREEDEKTSPTPVKSCGVICSRAGYYIKPSAEELDKLVDGNGDCYVEGFEVGRLNFGKIKFLEAVNVAGINVDEIVFFRHKEVVVYPDDNAKPPLYEGLNVPAEIELERVWPIDKETNEAVHCLKKIGELKYEEKLKKACVRLGAEFLAYDGVECCWKFRVAHFSKYSCDLEEQDEESEKNGSTTSKASSVSEVGLGGIPQNVMAVLAKHVVGPGGDAGAVTPPEVAHPHITEKLSLLNNVISIDNFWEETEATPPKRSRAHGKLDLSDFSTPPQSIYSLIWPDEEPSSPRNPHPFKGRLIRDTFQVPASPKPLLQPPPQARQQDNPKPPPEPEQQPMMQVVEPLKSLSLKVDEPEDVFARLKTGDAVNVKLEGCPRVCFLPRGQFLTINQRVTAAAGFSAQMEISQFYSYEKLQESFIFSEPYRAVLKKQMENRFRVRQATLFREHIETIQNQLKYTTFPPIRDELEEELCVWQLCDILWPPKEFDDEVLQDNGYPLTQRISLSKWLVDNVSILFGDEYNLEDNSVLGLLKKGLVEKACEAAIAQGNSFLATVIATEPHLLLDYYEELFDPEISAIFALISGSLPRLAELTPEKLSGSSAHEWFQYFALFIWFHGPERSSLLTPVNEAVREYEALMRTISGTDEASPFPSLETSTIANLCMELLKLFSCPSGYPLPRLLRPRTWTEDFLDYKLVWLLLRDFEEMRFHTEDETYFELCLNFANQLEVIGMWTWAIFVVKNIVPSPYEDDKDEWTKLYKKRDAFYQRLLERNINQDRMDDYFLVHRLGIKEKLIYSVKNWKSELAYEKIWYLGRIGKWQQSLEMLINYLIRGNGLALVAEENNASGYSRNVFDYLRSLRRKCKAMESWETGGKMLYDYATFKMIQVRDAEKEKKEEDELLRIVASFLDSVTKFQPSGMNNCALLLEMVVSVQKVVQCLFTSAEIESSAKEQFYESLQQFFKIPIPPEYFEGLRKFIDANWSFIKDENISA